MLEKGKDMSDVQTVTEEKNVYRRAKMLNIALSQLNSGGAMCFYILMTYASYCANAGYGVATATVGLILTASRIFDGITDPIVALLVDRTNTSHGKIRLWLMLGWGVESVAVFTMFDWASDKGHGLWTFVLCYALYIIGYTMNNITGQIIGPVMTNDPKQRPMVGVWATIYNYLTPMIFMMVITLGVLPRYNNEYTVDMLRTSAWLCVIISFVFVVTACCAVRPYDIPENFAGVSTKNERIKFTDMLKILKGNRGLQMYILAATSDKFAQQANSQSIVSTILFGILIGNIQLGTIISVVAMLPGIIFAIIGAKYATKHGNKEANVTWTRVCLALGIISVVVFGLMDMSKISTWLPATAIFLGLTLLLNASKMCVTTATNAMMADVIDYELDRSGRYAPTVVTGTYSFVDKLVSSLGILLATGSVALIGYTDTMPQPTDEATLPIKIVGIFLYWGVPILGWIMTLIAMKFYPLNKETMREIAESIHDKKEKMTAEHIVEEYTGENNTEENNIEEN